MKITKEDIGKKVWHYLKQEWLNIVGFYEYESSNWVKLSNGYVYKDNGFQLICDKTPILFWEEIKPIPHKERPKKIVKVEKGVVIARAGAYLCEYNNPKTQKEFEKSYPDRIFLCFAPDKEIIEVEEEVEE